MYISRIQAKNWRNFRSIDVNLAETNYIIGPNASGKSNLLDIVRFMRDVVNPNGGGLQYAVKSRGDMKKLRCLAGRQGTGIELEFELSHKGEAQPKWRYLLCFSGETRGKRRATVLKEQVFEQDKLILNRPLTEDNADPERLTETYLELTNSNVQFREIAEFFQKSLYLHLVPQLLKHSELFVAKQQNEADPFGQGFLNQIAATTEKTRTSRLKRTENILKRVIPHFRELRFVKDSVSGTPHLEMRYLHWRPNAGWQREDQFSDGTLRLIALIWTLMSSDNVILLEEPELSLHRKIVEQLPRLLATARGSRKKSSQVFISTHSPELLSDNSIDGQFLILMPRENGESTDIEQPTESDSAAMRAGMSAADILLPKTSMGIGELVGE